MSLKLTIATVALASVLVPATGRAQIGGGVFVCTNCATEPTQISIKLMHDLEYAKQLLQYAIQVQHLADALKNTAHGGAASLTNIAGDLNELANVVQGGRALAYSLGNQDVLFRQTYPGYQPWTPGLTTSRILMPVNTRSGRRPAWQRHKASCEAPVFKESCWRPNKACSGFFAHLARPIF